MTVVSGKGVRATVSRSDTGDCKNKADIQQGSPTFQGFEIRSHLGNAAAESRSLRNWQF